MLSEAHLLFEALVWRWHTAKREVTLVKKVNISEVFLFDYFSNFVWILWSMLMLYYGLTIQFCLNRKVWKWNILVFKTNVVLVEVEYSEAQHNRLICWYSKSSSLWECHSARRDSREWQDVSSIVQCKLLTQVTHKTSMIGTISNCH